MLFSAVVLCKGQNEIQVSGYIQDASSKESLQFAFIKSNIIGIGAASNEYGFFSLTIPSDTAVYLTFSYLGYKDFVLTVNQATNKTVNVFLETDVEETEEFVVTAKRGNASLDEVRSNKMSSITLPIKNIKSIPSIGGEVDIIKVVQLLPGVSKGVEGGTGMFVRGGDADQNLIQLDEAIVYNVGHLFGFFSVFNPDAIKDLTLIKGAFPANYGGRLSSILDIRMKEGDAGKIHGSGGIGLLSSRLTLEGPILKDKMSFLVAGRRTYIDKVFGLVGQNIPYYFYDLNAKVNYIHSNEDRFYFSTYFGDDVLKLDEDIEQDSANSSPFGFGFNLRNMTQTLRWNHIFNEKLFLNTSLIHTIFNYDIRGSFAENNVLIRSQIRDFGLKNDFSYYHNSKVKMRFGLQLINHNFKPNIISTSGIISEFLESQKGLLQSTLEASGYFNYEYKLDTSTTVAAGLRLSSSFVQGKTYINPEPRLSAKRNVGKNAALKASYSRMVQYMHRVSNSTVALPTDLWYPISEKIKPQVSDQVAIGYHQYVPKMRSMLSIEAYYKWMDNLVEYKEGTNLILNDNFEESLIQGNGKSYGVEFLLKRDEGKLNGWAGYTLSWSQRQYDGLNGGRTFFAKYDRRHDVSLVLNYDFSKRSSFSVVWVFANGSRFTPIIGQYFVPNAALTAVEIIPIYTERNAISLNSSHRLDVNWVIRNKKTRWFKYEWHIGGYNIYNRATPYTVRVVPDETGYKYEQPGLFGFIPSIAINFNF